MSVNLNVINNFTLTNLNFTDQGCQGVPGDGTIATTAYAISINGYVKRMSLSLATATALKIWDSSVDSPTTFSYLWFNADQNCYLQFITSATNFICQTVKGVPFTLSAQTILCAANTTPISGSAPSTTVIAKIYVQQNSGNSANIEGYIFN